MSLKSTAAFKLNQQTKRIMACITDTNKCNKYKRIMINAQLSEAVQPRITKFKRDDKESE
jgi:hypothetical protein